MKTIAIINESTVCTDAEIQAMAPDLQTQITRDFSPIWGWDATLVFVAKGGSAPAGAWLMHVLDNSDQAGALGYHDLLDGIPRGFVFAADDKKYGNQVSVTLSHEILEMLADPLIFSTVLYIQHQGWRGQTGVLLALEVADAPEADQFAYKIGNTMVSDFVTPAWFGSPPAKLTGSGVYDFQGHCTAPFQILQGGYIGVLQLRGIGQWGQVTGQRAEGEGEGSWQCHQKQGDKLVPIAPPRGSRRDRRGFLHQAMPTKLFGPVRNDIDGLVGHAEDSLGKVDNATNWAAGMLADLATGKKAVHVALEMDPKPGFSAWLQAR